MIDYSDEREQAGRCQVCNRMLAPTQNYCREHKCSEILNYGNIRLTCQKELGHTGNCVFLHLGVTINTVGNKN